jgi:hypothetical protein
VVTKKITSIALVILFLTGTVRAEEMRDLILQALSSDNPVSGTVTGKVAETFQQGTTSTSPVTVTIKKIAQYPESCARLEATFHQDGVPLKEGGVAPLGVSYTFNMCPDGLPPKDVPTTAHQVGKKS